MIVVIKPHEMGCVGLEDTRPAPRRPEEHRAHFKCQRVFHEALGKFLPSRSVVRMVPQCCPAAPPDPQVPSKNLMVNFCCLSPYPERSLRWAWSTLGSVCSSPSQEHLHCDFVVCLLGLFGIYFLRKEDAFDLELRNRCASERFVPDKWH